MKHGQGHGGQGRVSIMAYVKPDYDQELVPLPAFSRRGQPMLYEKTTVGEAFEYYAGRGLGLYDEAKQDRMRQGQGLYNTAGETTQGNVVASSKL